MMGQSAQWSTIHLALLLALAGGINASDDYRGKPLGKLSQLNHGVSGEVYAVDARTLHISNFNYDGEGPAAYFYVGTSKAPSGNGIRIRDERGTTNVLPRYKNKDITLSLPEGMSLQNVRWFSVWCDEFSVNFGDIRIPKNFDFPRPHKLGALNGIHGVSSDQVVIVDAQTLLVPNFSYDGEAPDAKFWVGSGSRPTPQGIRVADENGKEAPLRRYERKTIVLTLPGDMTVFDIGHFGVWCEAFAVDFAHVLLPSGLNVPPSLRMLGVSPQSKLNCEVLWDELAFEVRWAVAGDSIVLQLVARLEDGEYMAFGISGDDVHSKMVGGDVTVAWVDKDTLKGQARDYYLDAKSQCSGGRGSCPDENIADRTNSVRLLNAALVNGYSIVTFQRSLKPQDEFDRPFLINGTQPIIWAVGPLNARHEVSYHSLANRADILLDFGRPPKWNCPTPEGLNPPEKVEPAKRRPQHTTEGTPDNAKQGSNRRDSTKPKVTQTQQHVQATPAPVPRTKPWDIPAIQCNEPEDGVFYAQMGPTGGKRGYPAITGHVGWGISWYINGLLIPEINVVRGRTYTFIVEGGLDSETPARYHPFYITDDPVGGYEYKTPEERAEVQIFAGAVQNKRGEVRPTGLGRLCNWTPDQSQPPADEFASFGAYQRTLKLQCDPGEPGIVQWTVTKDTPDTVYYQCYTHRYLGWKINVLDDCEEEAGSDPQPTYVIAPQFENKILDVEPEAEASIQHVTKVRPESKPLANPDEPYIQHSYQQFSKNSAENQPIISSNEIQPASVKYVPEFHFYNQETGEPLDDETIHKMKLEQEIQNLQSQFLVPQPQPAQQEAQQLQAVQNRPPPHASLNFNSDEQFLNFFHTPKPMYSVNEDQEDVEQVVPALQFQLTPQTEKPSPIPTSKAKPMHYETTTMLDEKFSHEFLKNYQQLQIEAAAKLKKHNQNFQQHFSKPPRLQYNAPRRPSTPHHALTLQQRPLPPGMFRPPFMPPPPPKKQYTKRPLASPSQKVPTFSTPNNIAGRPYMVPQKPPRKEQTSFSHLNTPHPQLNTPLPHSTPFPHQMKTSFAQVLALQKLISTMRPHDSSTFSITPRYTPRPRITTETIPLAFNTGFNPHSVKVEGGFKPILNTGIAPSFKTLEDRMDIEIEAEDPEDDIGVIDLTKIGEKVEARQQVNVDSREEEILSGHGSEQDHLLTTNTSNDLDIFKHLKPVMFEPMFVPSPPDRRIEKLQYKLKKKTVNPKYYGEMSIKSRNNHLEPYNSHKNKYIKMRPRPNLIRRPLYPNNVMPPFKIPVKGGSPQFRYQQSNEEIEDTTDFDIIPMNNDTLNTEDDKAENILDVIEMEKENNGTESGSMELVILNSDDGQIFESEFQVENSTNDEVAMADERRDFYLPPHKSRDTVTYDGKRVSAIAAPTLPEPSGRFDFSKIPQFAPFQGDLPPIGQSVSIADLPQLRDTKPARGDILPVGQRKKRSPDHIPGHVGPHDHDHDHHDHHAHEDHSQPSQSNSGVLNSFSLMAIVPLLNFVFL